MKNNFFKYILGLSLVCSLFSCGKETSSQQKPTEKPAFELVGKAPIVAYPYDNVRYHFAVSYPEGLKSVGTYVDGSLVEGSLVEYEDGPDMTDFGHRWLKDPEFKKQYLAEKKAFCQRVLDDDEFAKKYGDLGLVYGSQWRHWKTSQGDTIDQLANVIHQIKTTPNSRRMIVSAWNPEDVPSMALPPCHTMFQFYVNDGKLSCQLYQRSADIFLGVPFNIASYALLTEMIAHECGLKAGDFVHTLGDAHIYFNHLDQVKEQLSRTPHAAPKLILPDEPKPVDQYQMTDIKLEGYTHEPAIKAPVAV